MNKNKKNKRTKIITGAAVAVVITVAVLLTLEVTNVTNFFGENNNSPISKPTNTINYDPPTAEESVTGDQQKEKIIDQNNISEEASDETETTKNASVVITDASQYGSDIEVRAFVSNVIQNGTCTFVFSNGNSRVEKQTPANADASSTPCITLLLKRSEFPNPGTWSLTITYDSNSASGSQSTTLEIE